MKLAALFILAISIAACDTSLTPHLAGLGPGNGLGSDTCRVQSVIVTPDSTTLRVGQTLRPTATVLSCASSANEGVRWASSDTNVAIVDAVLGFIQARRVGSAIITATAVADGSVRARLTVNVTP
jgi:uncharacterized protein YjdB